MQIRILVLFFCLTLIAQGAESQCGQPSQEVVDALLDQLRRTDKNYGLERLVEGSFTKPGQVDYILFLQSKTLERTKNLMVKLVCVDGVWKEDGRSDFSFNFSKKKVKDINGDGVLELVCEKNEDVYGPRCAVASFQGYSPKFIYVGPNESPIEFEEEPDRTWTIVREEMLEQGKFIHTGKILDYLEKSPKKELVKKRFKYSKNLERYVLDLEPYIRNNPSQGVPDESFWDLIRQRLYRIANESEVVDDQGLGGIRGLKEGFFTKNGEIGYVLWSGVTNYRGGQAMILVYWDGTQWQSKWQNYPSLSGGLSNANFRDLTGNKLWELLLATESFKVGKVPANTIHYSITSFEGGGFRKIYELSYDHYYLDRAVSNEAGNPLEKTGMEQVYKNVDFTDEDGDRVWELTESTITIKHGKEGSSDKEILAQKMAETKPSKRYLFYDPSQAKYVERQNNSDSEAGNNAPIYLGEHNKTYKSLQEALQNPIAVKDLDLSQKGLILMPDLSKFTNLKILNLSGNEMYSLSESIGQLSKLEYLDVSKNDLVGIPSSLGDLSNLQVLRLDNNKLVGLRQCIGRLIKLTHLDLSNNEIISLPISIKNLKALKTFRLEGNPILEIVDWINNRRDK